MGQSGEQVDRTPGNTEEPELIIDPVNSARSLSLPRSVKLEECEQVELDRDEGYHPNAISAARNANSWGARDGVRVVVSLSLTIAFALYLFPWSNFFPRKKEKLDELVIAAPTKNMSKETIVILDRVNELRAQNDMTEALQICSSNFPTSLIGEDLKQTIREKRQLATVLLQMLYATRSPDEVQSWAERFTEADKDYYEGTAFTAKALLKQVGEDYGSISGSAVERTQWREQMDQKVLPRVEQVIKSLLSNREFHDGGFAHQIVEFQLIASQCHERLWWLYGFDWNHSTPEGNHREKAFTNLRSAEQSPVSAEIDTASIRLRLYEACLENWGTKWWLVSERVIDGSDRTYEWLEERIAELKRQQNKEAASE